MKEKYDLIGQNYNLTRKADPYLLNRLYNLLEPQAHHQYLDIGCGTGNYTVGLNNRGLQLIGVEPSDEMLRKARAKSSQVEWLKGKAENIPLSDQSIDGILGSLTIHHWTNLELGFRELSRVLKSKGRIVIFTATPHQMKGYWLNHYFPKMLDDSMIQMPSYELLKTSMNKGGFDLIATEKYFIHKELQDLFLYSGKHDPQRYLDPQVRHGISSFSALANAAEVKQGLQQLQEDIATGRVNEIISQYENEEGDYLYVIGQKKV